MRSGPNPIILGRKICSKCKRWRHIQDFSCQKREPFKLQSQCHACARVVVRKWYEENPEKRAEYTRVWRERHLEQARESGRLRQAERRHSPRTRAKVRRQTRKAWRKMRKDPERWAERLAKQREDYARRKQDPEWAQRQRDLHRAQYENGGREAAAARRARDKLRRRLAVYLVLSLREELTRREAVARAGRERKRAYYEAMVTRRRAAWEAGEYDNLQPVFRYGSDGPELQRLPAKPLAEFIERDPRPLQELADAANVAPRAITRYTTGEQPTIRLEILDAFVTRWGVLMFDIYDPGRYPVLYEVAEDDEDEGQGAFDGQALLAS